GNLDTARMRFNAQGAERVTVRVVDADGATVATLLDDEPVEGPTFLDWDGRGETGTLQGEGAYRFLVSRSGDARTYAPSEPTMLDVTAPRGRVDKLRYVDGVLTGLLVGTPGLRAVITGEVPGEPAPTRLPVRTWTPLATAQSGRPVVPARADEEVVRFRLRITPTELAAGVTLYVADDADNRRELAALDTKAFDASGMPT
ncbi:MAG: FlgD Ig-like domain, partial [Thermoleophilia bacterium]|nr:FlgD Ig-like domain [Thermoleophilia bacterium]